MTCRYELPPDLSCLDNAVITALTAVINDQPLLRVGILKEDTNEPTFSHITQIDLQHHFDVLDAEAATEEEFTAEGARRAARMHDQQWKDVAKRPPWKITVMKPQKGTFPKPTIDIFFSFHHSLMDGTGGREFHQHLVVALRTTAPQANPPTKLNFADAPELPEPEEEAVGFKHSYSFMAKVLWKTFFQPSFLKPKPAFAGKNISLTHPHVTRALPVDFPPEVLASLVKGARENGTSLTGLLQALILTSFSMRLSAEEGSAGLQCTTPINLRPYLLPSANQALKTKLRAAVTALTTDHPPSVVSSLRENPSDELIWQSARRVKDDLVSWIAKIPNDDPTGLIHMISDLMSFFRNKDGQPRETLWECSNVGPFQQDKAENGWKVTRFMFSGSPMVAGAAVGFNTASVDGLTITLTWQEGILDAELLEGVARDLLQWADRWHQQGKFI